MSTVIKLLVLDVDGVLTDGQLYYGPEGEMVKAFNVKDGMGLALLVKAGVRVAVVSAKKSAPLKARLDDLGIRSRRLGASDKVTAIEDIMSEYGFDWETVAFMGDDLNDIAALEKAGLSAAPSDAVQAVKDRVDFITQKAGGQGAVRELVEKIAADQSINLVSLATGHQDDTIKQ